MRELLDRYAGVLLDVYGVLLDASGPLPGAQELLAELGRRGTPFAIVTNDASRSPESYARRLAVPAERVVTSGSLVAGALPPGSPRVCVLGTPDSFAYVRAGGGVPIAPVRGIEIDALAVCDDDGFEFLPGVEHALSAVVRGVIAGRPPALVLPNPDIVYPKGGGELGFTAGAIALMIEAALARRFPELALSFVHLGKPEPGLFLEAARRLGIAPERLVMVGDQLETDVAGARAAGMDAALVAGISRWSTESAIAPRWLLDTIAP